MMLRQVAALAIGMAGMSAPALAEQDAQAWGSIVASGAVKGDLFLWFEGQGRATDDVGAGSQMLLRTAIGSRIAGDGHAIAGYAYIRTDPEGGRTTNEHRFWQQVQLVLVRSDSGAPTLASRTRLEQRTLEGRDGTGWRLRQFVRGQVPIGGKGLLAIGSSEAFVNLNSVSWGPRDGLDQWRNFAGVGIPVGPATRVEAGYMNQHVFRRGEDRSNHILSATLFVKL